MRYTVNVTSKEPLTHQEIAAAVSQVSPPDDGTYARPFSTNTMPVALVINAKEIGVRLDVEE